MRIQFLGACRTVTGTAHLLEIAGKRVLLDCGMYQGARDVAREFNRWLPEELLRLDAIVLSHGHLDHCGKLPTLVKAGYNGPIYCTEATADVARVVMTDAAEIQVEDAEYLNKRERRPDEPPVEPLYTPTDSLKTCKLFRTVKYGQPISIGGNLSFTLLDAGHILGSAYVCVNWKEKTKDRSLLFTADIGRYDAPIINDPYTLPGAFDIVISESTYGGRTHAASTDIEPQLLAAVKEVIARKGRLIVPSFAVGRTQTILWYMRRFIDRGEIPPIKLYVDSPMGVEMTDIYERHKTYFDAETAAHLKDQDLFASKHIRLASSSQQSRQINADRGPCVIIASSPTCEFGRVLHHLKQSIEDPRDMVIFVGFTPANTLGRRIQDGQKRVRILNRFYDVKCDIRTIHGLSAHADSNELLRFLEPTLKPTSRAFVVHGEVDQAQTFAQSLVEQGVSQAVVPACETDVYS